MWKVSRTIESVGDRLVDQLRTPRNLVPGGWRLVAEVINEMSQNALRDQLDKLFGLAPPDFKDLVFD